MTLPRPEYGRRLEVAQAQAELLRRRDRLLSRWRLVLFLLAVVLLLVAFDSHSFSSYWALPPGVVFLVLVFVHEDVAARLSRAERIVQFYEAAIDRLEERWMGKGNPGNEYPAADHPYAADLDLFGRASLFERICSARTLAGERALAQWFLETSPPDVVRARQTAVAELTPLLDLREALHVAASAVRAGVDPEALTGWASRPGASVGLARVAAAVVVAHTVLAFAAAMMGLGFLWLGIALLLQTVVGSLLSRRVHEIIHGVAQPDHGLDLCAAALKCVEAQQFSAARLVELRHSLDADGEPPSRRIARLHQLVQWLDARKNQLLAPVAGLVMWTTHCALAIEAWRLATGNVVGTWIAALGEIEALLSLAGYAFDYPNDVFAEILDGGPALDAVGLAHPLINETRAVRNDVHLGKAPQALIVSGSNMSGKSTLLRSVGTNAVLAFAGAPVRARSLRLSVLAVGASIRTLDSLQDGTSRFYAEIQRLKQLMDLGGGKTPLLFLLDEILHGTNSHDRGIGAEAIVRGFLACGAIGLVTTHDLALTRVAEGLAPVVINVHFEDILVDGKMSFDYRMHPGVVTHSNALALMRAVGLQV